MARFADRVLLATGGGSGIAAATARRFAAEGGAVALLDLDVERARAVAEECGGLAVACDVADEAVVAAAVAAVVTRLGRLDCVVNSAGHTHHAPLEETTLADWNRMLAVHATGTFLVCRAALPALRAAGGGSIVNVASAAALVARPNAAAYAAAKGAVLAFSRQLARDVAALHIRVNVVAPGPVRTPLTEQALARSGGAAGAETLQRRVAEAREIADPICFLLSDDASFVTGTVLVADGGLTAI